MDTVFDHPYSLNNMTSIPSLSKNKVFFDDESDEEEDAMDFGTHNKIHHGQEKETEDDPAGEHVKKNVSLLFKSDKAKSVTLSVRELIGTDARVFIKSVKLNSVFVSGEARIPLFITVDGFEDQYYVKDGTGSKVTVGPTFTANSQSVNCQKVRNSDNYSELQHGFGSFLALDRPVESLVQFETTTHQQKKKLESNGHTHRLLNKFKDQLPAEMGQKIPALGSNDMLIDLSPPEIEYATKVLMDMERKYKLVNDIKVQIDFPGGLSKWIKMSADKPEIIVDLTFKFVPHMVSNNQ